MTLGHREGLAGTGHAEKNLAREAVFKAFDKPCNRASLIASGLKSDTSVEAITRHRQWFLGQICRFTYHRLAFRSVLRASE